MIKYLKALLTRKPKPKPECGVCFDSANYQYPYRCELHFKTAMKRPEDYEDDL